MRDVQNIRPFILAFTKQKIGTYSYVSEVAMEELKEQIKKCKNSEIKALLEGIYKELVDMYFTNKEALDNARKNLERYERFLIWKTKLFRRILFVLILGIEIILAWLIEIFFKNLVRLLNYGSKNVL